MKRFFLLLIFITTIIYSYSQDSTMNIAVLDLDPKGISKTDAEIISDRLRSELVKTQRYQVIERDKMFEILTEQGFQQTGCTTIECAVEVGHLLNVTHIVAGSIGKIDNLFSINIRIINVETGQVVKSESKDYTGELKDILVDVIPELGYAMAEKEYEKLPVDLYRPQDVKVLEVKGKRLLINIGSTKGIKLGKLYEIVEENKKDVNDIDIKYNVNGVFKVENVDNDNSYVKLFMYYTEKKPKAESIIKIRQVKPGIEYKDIGSSKMYISPGIGFTQMKNYANKNISFLYGVSFGFEFGHISFALIDAYAGNLSDRKPVIIGSNITTIRYRFYKNKSSSYLRIGLIGIANEIADKYKASILLGIGAIRLVSTSLSLTFDANLTLPISETEKRSPRIFLRISPELSLSKW